MVKNSNPITGKKVGAMVKRGFTIVELLIVVVVIAILAAVTIVAYNGITNQARDSVTKSTVAQLEKTLMMGQVERGDGHVIAPAGIDEEVDRNDFIEANNLGGLLGGLCVYDSDWDWSVAADDPPCLPRLVEGKIPTYDKSKVYIYDYGYSSTSVYETVVFHTSHINYSRWVEADNVWVSIDNRFSKGTLDHIEDSTNRYEKRYRCSPVIEDYMFTESCEFHDIGNQ